MNRSTKKRHIQDLKCRDLRVFWGEFLKFGKCADVKDLTNIMSAFGGCISQYIFPLDSVQIQYIFLVDLVSV